MKNPLNELQNHVHIIKTSQEDFTSYNTGGGAYSDMRYSDN